MTNRAKTTAKLFLVLITGLAIAVLSDHDKALSSPQSSDVPQISSEQYLLNASFGDTDGDYFLR